jgi:hypothetical protein
MGAHSGVYAVIDKLTSQGFDMQFGTNVLGTYETSKKPMTSFLKSDHTYRTLLSHQIAPSAPHGNRKELSSGVGARRQCHVHQPPHVPIGGYTMIDSQSRRRLSCSGEETWRDDAIQPKQASK